MANVRRVNTLTRTHILAATLFGALAATVAAEAAGPPIVLLDQGSFAVGGNIVTNPGVFDALALTSDGQTIHGDHAYVQYQVPYAPFGPKRKYPLVMWHGGGQFSKTWESTPDGRDGFQNIFLRRGFTTYIFDQPHRGRSGRATTNGTVTVVPGSGSNGEQGIFMRFRIGLWPSYFPGVQFSTDPEAINQWWRQQVSDVAATGNTLASDAIVALFTKIGPAVLITHSASGILGWITAPRSPNVKGIYSYEPVAWTFPTGEVPPPFPAGLSLGPVSGTAQPLADFLKLTTIPIEEVWGDNFPRPGQTPSIYANIDIWRGRIAQSQAMVDKLIEKGSTNAHLTDLPATGIMGNTHFEMSDLNNVVIADLLSKWLHDKGLD